MAATIQPHFRCTATSPQLIVDGKPFLMLAGEVQNSQFSSSRYMKEVWPRLKAAHLNTVFGSVAWEQIEPTEGSFDFSNLDEIINDARTHQLRLVLLWFGSFKNGLSTYVPPWIKQNPRRFRRAMLRAENGQDALGDVLSVFEPENQEADARAFAALMRHLKQVDSQHSTVIMVQVENEVGLLGDTRDRSPLADAVWKQRVPQELLNAFMEGYSDFNENFRSHFPDMHCLDTSKVLSWDELCGTRDHVEEVFMAYHYAKYVERVASSGKREHSLPLYTNVWQNYAEESSDADGPAVAAGGGKPGDYPCGGGVANVLDIWQLFAPSLDLIAPDIYLNDYTRSCAIYRHRNQPLLIPEQRRDEYGALRIWTAFGSYQCIGTAPFGIDTLSLEENPFRKHYELLSNAHVHVLEAQSRKNGSVGFFFDELDEDGRDPSPSFEHVFGEWTVRVERSFVFGRPSAGCGMIIHQTENSFLLLGWGFQVKFRSTNKAACFTGILKFEEKEVVHELSGQLRTLRMLNGDETRSGQQVIMPSQNPDYGGFPISICIPAKTGLARCEPYTLLDEDA